MATATESNDDESRTARLFSGELEEEEERENVRNELQEGSEWRIEDDEPLVAPPRSSWRRRHRRLLAFLLALSAVLAANLLAYYFVYVRTSSRLKVLAYNVWGMPGGMGGCKDKEQRVEALAEGLRSGRLGEYDLVLLEELWMEADHSKIEASLPEGFAITGYRQLASAWCEGRVLITSCSGLAIVSRFPFKEVQFELYTYRGSVWDGEAFVGKGVGRVRVEPPGRNLTVDVFVTHTIADGTTVYNNTWARILQVEELVDSHILRSTADVSILGGDFNSPPDRRPGTPFDLVETRGGMTNTVQELFYRLERWLLPSFATYGNDRNVFSRGNGAPITVDYVFYRVNANADRTACWTNWFELPFFSTVLMGGLEHRLRLEAAANETGKPAGELSAGAHLQDGESLVISLSDHEPVTSTIYCKKWSAEFPFL